MQVEPTPKRLKSTAKKRVQTVLFDFDGTLTMREVNPKKLGGERVAKNGGCNYSPSPSVGFSF